MEKPTVENKVKEIAEAMGLTYLCESWFRANQAFDRFRRQGDRREVTHPDGLTLPACLYVQPVAGFLNFTSQGFVRDAPSCLISFADAMPLDYKGAEAQEIAGKLQNCPVKLSAKAGNGGKLFGAVTNKEISEGLKAQYGVDIPKQKIVLDEPIKAYGSYQVKAKLGFEVSGTVYVTVCEEK